MSRELAAALHGSVAEATGVVGTHRLLIAGVVVVDEADALDGVALGVEIAEDGHHVVGNGFVTDEEDENLDPDAGKTQQQVIDEITGQLNLFPDE